MINTTIVIILIPSSHNKEYSQMRTRLVALISLLLSALALNTGPGARLPAAAHPAVPAATSGGPVLPLPVKPAPIVPVTGHPRLWVTAADLPRLRAWATAGNPVYQNGLRAIAVQARTNMDNGLIPAQDNGGTTWSQYPCEEYAQLFAFMSLIESDAPTAADYAARARTLLMYVMDRAVLGASAGVPFRDPHFSTTDRSRWWGDGFATTVDWIYPILTPADQAEIRTVFLRWVDENMHATTTGIGHPPIGLYNDPSTISTAYNRRWALNNYFIGHMRQIGMMALSFDAADDPSNTLRNYLRDSIQSWLYMVDAGLRTEATGGLSPEGFEYGPESFGRIMEFMWALHTAGQDDPAVWGQQVDPSTNPFYSAVLPALLHSSSPATQINDNWIGPVYTAATFADVQNVALPDFITTLGPLSLYAGLSNNTTMQQQLRWVARNMAPGGNAQLNYRMTSTLSGNTTNEALFYFMLLDPTQPATSDPHTGMATNYFIPGLDRLLSRTDWSANATWFTYKLGWDQIDHNHGDGNQFEFYRKGEWLTKERTGWGFNIATSMFHNTLALQINPPVPAQPPDSIFGITYARGSQWDYVNAGDPTLVAHSFGPGYTYALGDSTTLYNYPQWNGTDILHASRSILWLQPDYIVVYDRAVSATAGRYKHFWLELPALGSVSGNRTSVTTPGGQHLYVTTLAPANATIQSQAAEPLGNEVALHEPMNWQLQVDDPATPQSVRFLHVLQGADAAVSAGAVSRVQSSSGTAYDGTVVSNTAVMMPVYLTTSFTSLVYTVPATVTTHLITGLAANGTYSADLQSVAGGTQVTITPGGLLQADSGGVLALTPGMGNCTLRFADVAAGSTFDAYIHCLVCQSIVGGYNDAGHCGANTPCFLPGANVTRGQMAKFISNSAAYSDTIPSAQQTFTDVSPGSTFWLYVERAAAHGVISGYNDAVHCGAAVPCFQPGAAVTRGQTAKFVANAMNYADPIPPAQQTFADVPTTSTFWLYVERVAAHGIVGGYACGGSGEPCPGSYFRPVANVSRGQTAKFISNAFFPNCSTLLATAPSQ
jgi:hypothetical protein